MAFANEYRQFDPYAQPGFIKSASNPAEQGAYLAGAAQGVQAAYAAGKPSGSPCAGPTAELCLLRLIRNHAI